MTKTEEYLKSITIQKVVTEENAERLGAKVGDVYKVLKQPESFDELWVQFVRRHSQSICDTLIGQFHNTYGKGNKRIVEDELKISNAFISKANDLLTPESFKYKYSDLNKEVDNLNEYSKLLNGYYDAYYNSNYRDTDYKLDYYSFFNPNANWVYGKYVLYKNWLVEKLSSYESLEPKKSELDVVINLESFFKSIAQYKAIMEILVEQELIQSSTYLWRDRKGGAKGFLVGLIKYLFLQGYFKRNPSHKEIKSICANTFGLEVGIDTIKKKQSVDYTYSFVPIASTLE
ncbi:MAG: hypothetical protein ACI8ZM_003372 [Crocinitomix sp.]|jgi:hypothetical protein